MMFFVLLAACASKQQPVMYPPPREEILQPLLAAFAERFPPPARVQHCFVIEAVHQIECLVTDTGGLEMTDDGSAPWQVARKAGYVLFFARSVPEGNPHAAAFVAGAARGIGAGLARALINGLFAR